MEVNTLQRKTIITAMCTFIMAMTGLIIYDGTANESFALTTPDCQACHGTYPATLNIHHNLIGYNYSCYCHAGATPVRPNADPNHPDRDCLNCHYPGTTKFYRADDGTDVFASDVTTAHTPLHINTNVPSPDCAAACHAPAAITEHQKYPTFNPDPGVVELDCDRCHKNTNTDPGLGPINVQETIDKGSATLGNNLEVTCDECHTNITGAGHAEAHDNVKPDPQGGCDTAGCHASNVMIEHTSKGLTCGTCHNGETQKLDRNLVLQVIADSAGPEDLTGQTTAYCTDCHGEDAGTHVAAHNQGFFIMSTPSAQDCTRCHAAMDPGVDPNWANLVMEHVTNQGFTCATCHNQDVIDLDPNDVFYAIEKGKANDPVYCVDCHTPSGQGEGAGQGEGHPLISVEPWNQCNSQCHSLSYDPDPNAFTTHPEHIQYAADVNLGCAACHVPYPQVPSCDACHSLDATQWTLPNGSVSLNIMGPGTEDHDKHTVLINCSACHRSGVPGGTPLPPPYNECSTCHNSVASEDTNYLVLDNIMYGEPGHDAHIAAAEEQNKSCSLCHTEQPDCSSCHVPTHPAIPAPTDQCAVCHTTLQPGDATHVLHKDDPRVPTTPSGIVDCSVCHNPQPNCGQCHTAGGHVGAHDNVGVPSTGCMKCHDANVVVEHVEDRGFSCADCHDDPAYTTIIEKGKTDLPENFVYCYDCHGEDNHHATAESQAGNCTHCHVDPRPLDNDPQQLACRACHGSDMHNKGGAIQDFGACFDCHAPVPYHAKPTSWPGWYEENQQAPGRGIFNVFKNDLQPSCAGDCEGSLERRNGYGENSSPERLNDRNWRTPSSFNWFPIVYQGQSMNMPAFDPAQPYPPYPHNRINEVGNCGACHTVGTVVAVTHNNNCTGCHLSSDQDVQDTITYARAGDGNDVNCYNCHGNQGHDAAHNMTVLTDQSCGECHVANVFTEHVVNRQRTCTDCHDSNDPNVQNAIMDGKNGVPVPCQDCHGQNAADHAGAHDNVGVPSTGCTQCHDANVVVEHIDNRGFVCADCHNNPAYTTIIANGKTGLPENFVYCYDCHGQNQHHDGAEAQAGNCTYCHADVRLDVDPNAPTGQLACRQCHGTNQHDKGGPIQDYGACFACHQPTPYHAKPTRRPSDCYSTTPGKGTFNLFSSEFGGGGEHNERNERCEGRERDYRDPSISFSMVTIVDQLGTNRQFTVPTFGSSGGSGGGGGNDSVNITRAEYDSSRDRVRVYAENSLENNNAQLSVIYDGRSYDMNWDSRDDRWERDISASRCNDSTIEVVSSAGGSDSSSVSNCSSSSWGH